MKHNNLSSEIFGELRQRRIDRKWHYVVIALITLVIFGALCLVVYDWFYPQNLLVHNHKAMELADVFNNFK